MIFANYNPQSCTKMLETFLTSRETFFYRNLKNYSMSFWADVMLRQPRIQASSASPTQKSGGLRVVLFQKLFLGYIFCFQGDLFGRCIFEQYAHETNLKKKRSVYLCKIGLNPEAVKKYSFLLSSKVINSKTFMTSKLRIQTPLAKANF